MVGVKLAGLLVRVWNRLVTDSGRYPRSDFARWERLVYLIRGASLIVRNPELGPVRKFGERNGTLCFAESAACAA